jgi:hypothetical protein
MSGSFTVAAGLASAVVLGSKSRGTQNHILTSQIRDFPGTGWPSYTPRHLVPISSPPRILRATVEVFDPASTPATRNLS